MKMKLAVGATSRRLVEVAASLGVHQIVASHAQVRTRGGYTGMDQTELVALVRGANAAARQPNRTEVVRDHGHIAAQLDADLDAGFDGLHLDVEPFADADRDDVLLKLGRRYAGGSAYVELGGEHVEHDRNVELLRLWYDAGLGPVRNFVLNVGTRTWADRQCGQLGAPPAYAEQERLDVARLGLGYGHVPAELKLHNCDWIAYAELTRYAGAVAVFNVAPELGRLETDAILALKSPVEREQLLDFAYRSGAWRRWYNAGEGTTDDRARCALRYLQVDDATIARALFELSDDDESYVRGVLREWIAVRLG